MDKRDPKDFDQIPNKSVDENGPLDKKKSRKKKRRKAKIGHQDLPKSPDY